MDPKDRYKRGLVNLSDWATFISSVIIGKYGIQTSFSGFTN